MLRRVVRTIAAGSMAAAILACGSSSPSTAPTPVFTSVTVAPSSPTVFVGSTLGFTALPKDQNGSVMNGLPAASWTTSDATKATVDPSTGIATGVATGTTTITATIVSGSITHSGMQTLTVTAPSSTAGVTATSGLAFTPASVTVVRAGGTARVTWTFQSVAHTVTWDTQPTGATVADIPATSGASVARDFTVAGTYTYHCAIHPQMHGTVIVQ